MRNSANISLIGNLVREPELRQAGNQNVCSFRVAVSVQNPDRNSEEKYIPNYYDCSLWGKRGEFLANTAKKGMLVHVRGELVEVPFTRQNGTPGTALRINADAAEVETGERGSSAANAAPQRQTVRQAAPPPQTQIYTGEDLPF